MDSLCACMCPFQWIFVYIHTSFSLFFRFSFHFSMWLLNFHFKSVNIPTFLFLRPNCGPIAHIKIYNREKCFATLDDYRNSSLKHSNVEFLNVWIFKNSNSAWIMTFSHQFLMLFALVILNTCTYLCVSSWSSLSVCIRKQLDSVCPLLKMFFLTHQVSDGGIPQPLSFNLIIHTKCQNEKCNG